MNTPNKKLGIIATGILTLMTASACSSGGGSAGTSSSAAAAALEAKVNAPVYCQIAFNTEVPLPACDAPPANTCPNAQVADSNGNCVDYTCDSVTVLSLPTDGSTLQIPDRSAGTHGVCYAVKLISAIAQSASSLTVTHDPNVVSRNHDLNSNDPTNHWNPYLMGQATMAFEMSNTHQVDMTGAADATTPILVDNFIIVGIAPVLTNTPFQPIYYGAFGTSDSTTDFAGGSGNILISNIPIQLTPFAAGGTASVGPLNISGQVSTGIEYNLDVRAEDCGAVRNLSDIYIQFR